MQNKIVLVDYGGVLGIDHIIEFEKKLAKIFEISINELNNRLSEKSILGKAFRENKITEIDFWQKISNDNTVDRQQAKLFTQMWMDTYCLNDIMMEYLLNLKNYAKIGVLTNIDIGRSELLLKILNAKENFDYYFPSYQFESSKDTNELWQKVDTLLSKGNKDIEVMYIDDRIEHVLSAKKVGWSSFQFTDFIDFKNKIESFLEL